MGKDKILPVLIISAVIIVVASVGYTGVPPAPIWSEFQAISDVAMNGFNITNADTITANNEIKADTPTSNQSLSNKGYVEANEKYLPDDPATSDVDINNNDVLGVESLFLRQVRLGTQSNNDTFVIDDINSTDNGVTSFRYAGGNGGTFFKLHYSGNVVGGKEIDLLKRVDGNDNIFNRVGAVVLNDEDNDGDGWSFDSGATAEDDFTIRYDQINNNRFLIADPVSDTSVVNYDFRVDVNGDTTDPALEVGSDGAGFIACNNGEICAVDSNGDSTQITP